MKQLHAMKGVSDGAEVWSEAVSIPTYPPMPPDPNPMFLEKRVYQGSSGRVYPLPFIDRVCQEKVDQVYEAIHLENERLYLMVLPGIGGRIHIGFDKSAGYDFFYRQNVIKPALVGLAGPWISGGVEFNWPQHHRPATYMPCAWHLEEHKDGSKTVWLSDHDPMSRMKGMHGVCIRPGSSLIELKVRLYNRTPHVQTFLWWANVAAKVHERYQSFFPPDVRFVADHAKRATSTFPACAASYYGVPYGERGRSGVPASELPAAFRPDGSYGADRLDWYANIPVPTSYMVVSTQFDFFGGYDHAAGAGFVHVADRHISPGKKQWTWGNHEFGYAWDRNLTDEGGPYVELMAGVYTDNQPDFSFLAPYETKTFSQFWYPIAGIGPVQNATMDAALAWDGETLGLNATSEFRGATVRALSEGRAVFEEVVDLNPGVPYRWTIAGNPDRIEVVAGARELVSWEATQAGEAAPPEAATEPPAPNEVATVDELYLIGLHLKQYRHATRAPEAYWLEAVLRDPRDSRCQLALGEWRLRRGEFALAEEHLRLAIRRITDRNPNPYDGEAYYQLGLALEFQERWEESYEAYAKAAWNYAWKGPAQIAMARLACRAGRFGHAEELLAQARLGLGDAGIVGCLSSAVLRRLGKSERASVLVEEALQRDPLDHWALREGVLLGIVAVDRFRHAMRDDAQNYLDLALDYASAGLREDALQVLDSADPGHPMVGYLKPALGGDSCRATGPLDLFASRLEEIGILVSALERDPQDAQAAYLLGNLLYDRRRYEEAIEHWERTVSAQPDHATAWRNLGIAYYNVRGDLEGAMRAYERAVAADPRDARLRFEQDQLWKRAGVSPQQRLAALEGCPDLVHLRDDLTLELCALHCQTGNPEEAAALIDGRWFTPWEGGEGVALGQHARTHRLLARQRPERAVELLEIALEAPRNLGEARHLLANGSDLWLAMGDALANAGRKAEAAHYWRRAADFAGDFQEMAVKDFSEMTYYRALSLRRLDREEEARDLLCGLREYAAKLESSAAKIDYFATSLPTMLLFDENLNSRQTTTARFLAAQAELGLGDVALARKMLLDVLARDPNHAQAHDLLQEI